MPSKQKQLGGLTWVYITGIGFAISLAAAILLMARVDRTNLPDGLYYLILVPLGLSAAAFLFGALRGYAKYSGQVLAGNLELRGPAVLFLLVIILGFYANRATDFSLTVRVHGPGGPADVIKDGSLTVYLGNVQRTSQIGDDGEAIFNGVPSAMIGERVRVLPSVRGYELTTVDSVTIPESGVIEIGLARRSFQTTIRGTVVDEAGDPVAAATVDINSGMVTATSDAGGNFSAVVPMEPGSVVNAVARRTGFRPYDFPLTVSDAVPLKITLRRMQQ
jgi:hypothetical protein